MGLRMCIRGAHTPRPVERERTESPSNVEAFFTKTNKKNNEKILLNRRVRIIIREFRTLERIIITERYDIHITLAYLLLRFSSGHENASFFCTYYYYLNGIFMLKSDRTNLSQNKTIPTKCIYVFREEKKIRNCRLR